MRGSYLHAFIEQISSKSGSQSDPWSKKSLTLLERCFWIGLHGFSPADKKKSMSISHTYIGLSYSSFFKDCQISPRFTRGRRPCQWMKAFPSSKALANTAITYTLNTLKIMYEYVKPWTSIIPSSTYGFLKKM